MSEDVTSPVEKCRVLRNLSEKLSASEFTSVVSLKEINILDEIADNIEHSIMEKIKN